MSTIKTVGIVGAGVIGAGWAARALARGYDVVASDPGPNAEEILKGKIANAWPALINIGWAKTLEPPAIRFTTDLAELAAASDFIQESAPEVIGIKQKVHKELTANARPDVIIGSSSSGLLPTEIQDGCTHPERIVIGHPFNPVYLLPLCELVAGEQTSAETVDRAEAFYKSLGMHTLRVRKEVDAYLADRLQEAVWRECLHLIDEGVATTGDLDDAIVYGPGIRWAFMGVFRTYTLAGGDAGMRHFMSQFGPALKLPWTKLEAPELTDALIDRVVEGCEEQMGDYTIKELEQLRDKALIAIMRTLRPLGLGSGNTMAEDEALRLTAKPAVRWSAGAEIGAPLELYASQVDPAWIDYNGHMSESSYLEAFGWASDALFRYIGIDEAYRAAGKSFYTVETHINYYQETSVGEPLAFATQLLGVDDKRLHFFHTMTHGRTGELLATTEQMLLHVDMNASKASPISAEVREALDAIMAVHRTMEVPEQVGRRMAVPERV
ncbi:MAG: L-carnitine dehydrogenase [Rhodospirillales bacterium]